MKYRILGIIGLLIALNGAAGLLRFATILETAHAPAYSSLSTSSAALKASMPAGKPQ